MAARRPLFLSPRAAFAAVALIGLTVALAFTLAARTEPGPTAPPSGPRLLLPTFTYRALQANAEKAAPPQRSIPCPVASRGCATVPCIQFVAELLTRQGNCQAFPRARPHFYRITGTGR